MTLLNTHTHWTDAVKTLQQQGQDYVLATVLGSRGSTPRDCGTKMVFGREQSFGTIGGGHLEFRSAQIAASLLGRNEQHIEYFPLGPTLGQCCGGSTSVLFESFQGSAINLMLFGAGHVGASLVPLLQQMPCRVQWVDSRESFASADSDGNVSCIHSDSPADEVASMPAGSWYIIMTHNHQQDYEILRTVLKRGDAAYTGLIGSDTKWRRFQMRLQHEGFLEANYSAVHCPIGLADVPGKRPVEVAVSIAAQLIGLYNHSATEAVNQQGPGRRELQPVMQMLAAEEQTQ
jgi:xanthine dehydrogenase accessory factor